MTRRPARAAEDESASTTAASIFSSDARRPGFTPHRHVTCGTPVLDLEHLDLDGTVRERLEGDRPHELRRRTAHDDLHRRSGLRESPRELDRLVRGDRARDAEDDEAAAQRVA